MALVLKDRVKETTSTTGTGTVTLAGAVTGFQAFSAIGNGNTTYYTITGQNTSQWEVGIGTYTASGTTLSRDTVLASSNGGSLVNFSAGSKDVFVTYPAGKAIYEEANGTTVFNGGPISVIGANVTSYTQFTETLSQMYANVDNFAQSYVQNLNNGTEASADFAAYNDVSTGSDYFVDMGISSSNGSSAFYPILAANAGYLISYGDGGSNPSDLFVGTGDGKVTVFAGSFNPNAAVAVFNTDLSTELKGALDVPGTINVDGAATFGSTVLLNSNPTLSLQAATKQYVDQVASAGLHIHEPVLVETTGNLNATYAQGGTTFNITDITSGTTVTTSTTHGLSVNDQIWLTTTAGNGLSTNTAYFVFSTPANNQLTLSLTFGGSQITGLTNASGLSYATRANSGVGATLTNAGTQAALEIDGVTMAVNDRVMVRLQTNAAQNGVYTVTNIGSGSTNWVLTRATDANKVDPGDPNGLGTGDYFYTESGDINAGDSHVLTTEPNTMIIGYTNLTYTLFSAAPTYTGGTNITVSGQTISLSGTVAPTNGGTGVNTVTTGDLLYGSASNTWSKLAKGGAYRSLVMDGSGTNVEWNAVALNQSNAVSGALGATNGGTGLNSYTTGDIIYSSATNTLAKLSGNTDTTAKYLRQAGTGSASAAPTWSTLAAGDITSGTLSITYGGTGASTESGARTNLGATTLGSNLFTITNPSAVTYPQFNADNTVSALNAATFRAAIGAGTGSGTVTSVAIAGSTGINVSGSPITSSGTITLSLDSNIGGVTFTVKTANYTAVAKDAIIADTTGGSFTITLPATPTTGSQVIIADGGNWATNNLTIARNASTIEGVAEDLTCNVQGASLQLVYDGSTWEVYSIAQSVNTNIGYKNVPPVGTQTGSYTLVTDDVGKYVQVGSGGSITIPNSVFSEGDVVSIFNNTSGNITITCSITTAYIAGTDTDKSTMTLATRGVATVLFISGTVCVVSGNVS